MMHEKREAEMRVENVGTVNCPSCDATLVAGLRFCRMCGYRLGEGVEEYVQTQLLNGGAPRVAAPSSATDPFAARATWGHAPLQPNSTTSLGRQPDASSWKNACRPRRGRWPLWIVLAVALMAGGGVLPFTFKISGGCAAITRAPTSFIVVDGFDTVEGRGGAGVQGISGPNTPFVNAGLIGGDIITSFDGKQVADSDALRKILAETPAGKTVEVIYIRDGAMGKTMLTTMAEKDYQGMKAFDSRPGGEGRLEISNLDRGLVPSLNIYGVRVNDIDRNGPADLYGMKEGDIVIKFGDYPIRTEGDLRYRIDEAVPGSVVKVLVVRGAEQLEIPLKIGRSKN